jgi:hypothetical protein
MENRPHYPQIISYSEVKRDRRRKRGENRKEWKGGETNKLHKPTSKRTKKATKSEKKGIKKGDHGLGFDGVCNRKGR